MRDIATLPADPKTDPETGPATSPETAVQPGRDVSAYYVTEGNPPGVWIGRGAHLLDLNPREGQPVRIVRREQMQALFGAGLHPDAEARIAAYQRQHITAGMNPAQLEQVNADALRSVTLGRPFASYQSLAPFAERVDERLSQVIEETGRVPNATDEKRIRAEEARRQHSSIAGYDLVFAPVKSAALLWALDERAWVRDAVIAAHHEAKDATLALLEEHAAFTRTGTGGVAQIETQGLIGVSFDHFDSRDGDPNPHTHVAISNKVQGVDGIWRTLDGRALYRLTVAASEHYNTAFQVALSARTGVRFEAREVARGKQPVYEIAGISPALIKDFSRRRSALSARYEELTSDYRAKHGHDPSASLAHKLARRANLDTRRAKQAPRSLAAMRATWAEQALTRHGREVVRQVMAVVPDPEHRATPVKQLVVRPVSVQTLAAQVVANVAEKRSTWTVWNVRAEAERLIKVTAARGQPITGVSPPPLSPRAPTTLRCSTDITRILPTTPSPGTPTAVADTGDLVTHVRRYATTSAQLAPAETGLPPWLPAVPVHTPGHAPGHTPGHVEGQDQYTRAAADQLRSCVDQLTQDAIATRPAWLQSLGNPPSADTPQRAAWTQQVAIVAAYRDQHQTTDPDTHGTHQTVESHDVRSPLGPYIETASPRHQGYWQAAHALHQAHQMSQPHDEQAPRSTRTTSARTRRPNPEQTQQEQLGHQIAADLYRALPEAERQAISADITTKLGHRWLGPDPASGSPVGDLDAIVTHPAHLRQLHLVLHERGHLNDPTTAAKATNARAKTPGTGADQQARRVTTPRAPAPDTPAPTTARQPRRSPPPSRR